MAGKTAVSDWLEVSPKATVVEDSRRLRGQGACADVSRSVCSVPATTRIQRLGIPEHLSEIELCGCTVSRVDGNQIFWPQNMRRSGRDSGFTSRRLDCVPVQQTRCVKRHFCDSLSVSQRRGHLSKCTSPPEGTFN